MPPAGVVVSEFKKHTQAPFLHDDFMNQVFTNKPHRSYTLRDRADMRARVMSNKFKYSLNRGAEDDQRIQRDFENQNKANLEDEAKRKRTLLDKAMATKEFQIK